MPYSFRPSTIAKSYVSKFGISPKIAEFLSKTFDASSTKVFPAIRPVTRANKYSGCDFEMKVNDKWTGIEIKNTISYL